MPRKKARAQRVAVGLGSEAAGITDSNPPKKQQELFPSPLRSIISDYSSVSSSDDEELFRRRRCSHRKLPASGVSSSVLDAPRPVSSSSIYVLQNYICLPLRSHDKVQREIYLKCKESGDIQVVVEKRRGHVINDSDSSSEESDIYQINRDKTTSFSKSGKVLVECGSAGFVCDIPITILEMVQELFSHQLISLFFLSCSDPTLSSPGSIQVILLESAFSLVPPLSLPPIKRPIGRKMRNVLMELYQSELAPWKWVSAGLNVQSKKGDKRELVTPKEVYSALEGKLTTDKLHRCQTGVPGIASDGIIPKLRPYQEAAVDWMFKREKGQISGETIEARTLLEALGWVTLPLHVPNGGGSISYNPLNGCCLMREEFTALCRNSSPSTFMLRGGILAEEMGLGKTVEVLALILLHPLRSGGDNGVNNAAVSIDTSARVKEENTKCPVALTKSPYWDILTPRVVGGSAGNGCLCLNVISAEAATEMESDFTTSCRDCRWQLHTRCAAASLGIVDRKKVDIKKENNNNNNNNLLSSFDEYTCVACSVSNRLKGNLPKPSGATLIVCPATLLCQWQMEIGRHVMPGALSVAVYPGVREVQQAGCNAASGLGFALLRPEILEKHDIVLTTFDVLRTEVHHSTSNGVDDMDNVNEPPLKSLRYIKRYKVVPSPLTAIQWWRVVLDEAQMIESSTADAARMAVRLPACHRWCVSGTPLGRGHLDDLYGLLVFLRMHPFDQRTRWVHAMQRPVEARSPGAMERLACIVSPVMWRTTKKLVLDQLQLPPQKQETRMLKFSSIEKHFYEKQFDSVHDSALKFLHGRSTSSALTKLSGTLLKLRQACCHPQIGSCGLIATATSTSSGVGGVMSMTQILDRLIDDERQTGMETQRLLCMTLNGLAAVARMKAELSESDLSKDHLYANSVSLYSQALEMGQQNKAPMPVTGEVDIEIGKSDCQDPLLMQVGVSAGEPISLAWEMECTVDSGKQQCTEVLAKLDMARNKRLVCFRVKCQKDIGVVTCSVKLQSACHSDTRGYDDTACISCVPLDGSWSDWQNIVAGPNGRARYWRVVVSAGGGDCMRTCTTSPSPFVLDIEFKEARFDMDSLQMLHISHNMAEVLRKHENEAARAGVPFPKPSDRNVQTLEEMGKTIKINYLAGLRAAHQIAHSKLLEMTSSYEHAAASVVSCGVGGQWWDVALGMLETDLTSETAQAYVKIAHEALTLAKEGNSGGGRSMMINFPPFQTLQGLRAGLTLLHDRFITARRINLEKVSSLQLNPDPSEIALNAACGSCRKDWSMSGPPCSQCKLMDAMSGDWENLLWTYRKRQTSSAVGKGEGTFREEGAIPRLLRVVLQWVSESRRLQQYTGGASKTTISARSTLWTQLEKAGKLSISGTGSEWDCTSKELLSAREMHTAHSNLLSGIDELSSATQTIRLVTPNAKEDASKLTEDQRKLVAFPEELSQLQESHEMQRTCCEMDLSKSVEKMTFLMNLWYERHQSMYMQCPVCLENLGEEVVVASCGHSYHMDCFEMILTRGGFSSTQFKCPKCRKVTPSHEMKLGSSLSTVDGTQASVKIIGSWGTKVEALVADLLSQPEGENSIVFSDFDSMLGIIAKALEENGVSFVRLRAAKDFALKLPSFLGPGGPRVLLLPLRRGAEGLNLVEARHVYLLEPVLNAASEAQAINRVHRIGQTKITYVHRFIVEDTIEENIKQLQEEKTEAAGGIDCLLLTDAAAAKREASGLTVEDIRTIFHVENETE